MTTGHSRADGGRGALPGHDGPTGEDLRAAMGNFATGVAIATTCHDGIDHALTVNSLTSVSLDPPLVLISIGRAARFATPLRAAGVWGVSLLAEADAAVAVRFAMPGGPPAPIFEGIPHRRGATGVPVLDGALATLECRTEVIHPAGDHDIVVGRVVATTVGPASATGSTPATSLTTAVDERRPLVSFRGRFHTPPA